MIKEYMSPIVLVDAELSEDVYMTGSGSGDCWTMTTELVQRNAGNGDTNFRVAATHSSGLHISTETIVTITFNQPVSDVRFEGFDVSVNGNIAVLTRTTHANAYGNSDNFNTLMTVKGSDQDTLEIINATIDCAHAVNVQGGYD